MGMSPQRKSTPRTGLEDLVSSLFTQGLQQAATPTGNTGKGGSGIPSPTGTTGTQALLGQPGGGRNPYGGAGTSGVRLGFGGQGGISPDYNLGGRPAPTASLQDIYTNLSLPQYQGPMTAPTNPLQQQSLQAAGGGLAALPGIQQLGGQILGGLSAFPGAPIGPKSALDLLTNRPGSGSLGQLAGGGGVAGALAGFQGAPIGPQSALDLLGNRPGEDVLGALARGGAPGVDAATAALLGLGTGQTSNYGGILDALNQARQGSLSDTLRDVQERFSASGLRNSTNLAAALGETANRSEQEFLGLGAQLLPQLAGLQQGALAGAGQLGLGGGQLRAGAAGQLQQGGLTAADLLGQLFQGQQGRALAGLGEAGQLQLGAGQALQQGGIEAGNILGQLYQGQQGRSLSSLQSMPGIAELFASLPGNLAQQAYGIGSAQQAQETQGLQAKLQEFLRTQGALLAPILNFASGAPQITAPGKGSQLLGMI